MFPGAVVHLLPYIEGAAIEFVHSCLSHGHIARITCEEEIYVVDISALAGKIDAGKVPFWSEIGQVLHVHANELEMKLLALKLQRKVSTGGFGKFFDVLLDASLDVGSHHMGNVFGSRRWSCVFALSLRARSSTSGKIGGR